MSGILICPEAGRHYETGYQERERDYVLIEKLREFIEKHAMNNRVAVSDETNMVAEEVARILEGELVSVHSGAECLTWIIPKRWKVRDAYIETVDGKRVVDFQSNPLHLYAYSIPFKGVMGRKELQHHLYYDRHNPDNIPHHYKYQYTYGEEGWGFCLSYNAYKEMREEKYKVVVDSVLDDGVMKVADCYLKGEMKDTILIAAHNCHPAQVNDGLSSVAVALELFKYLKRQELKYSYRLVIGPEFYAAAAFLSKAEGIQNIKYGIFLDMLGNNEHMGISYSFQHDTFIDKVVKDAMRSYDKNFVGVPYRESAANDEFFYDGPDFYIPMVCIGRDDYPEYHLDSDDIAHCDFAKLGEFVELMKSVVRIIETDCIPVRKYRGPLFLSRYNIPKNTKADKAAAIAVDKIQILMDGKNSCLEISERLDLHYSFVFGFVQKLLDKKLAITKQKGNL